ncbi:MAG: hypothetical protein ACRD3D_16180 [Terriglobia bacterium]
MNAFARNLSSVFCIIPAALLATSVAARGPHRIAIRTEVSKNDIPPCNDVATGRLVGSKRVVSPVLTSPDGRFRAYAENDVVAFSQSLQQEGPPIFECANTARLFMAGPTSKMFRLVYLSVPAPYDLIKGVTLIDWSRDSRYLLFQVFDGNYASDAGGWGVGLLAARYGVFWPPVFPYQALEDHLRRNCSARIIALGFSQEDSVILKVSPYYDETGTMENDTCVKKQGLWSLDPSQRTMLELPDNYKVQQYGRWAEVPGK